MAKQASWIERPVCCFIDKIFAGIMALLYGQHPSETKAQKLTRWGLVLLAIVGTIVLFLILKALF
jgi:hypothetical protein